MDERNRKIKRSVILSIYALIFAFVSFIAYVMFGPEKETCQDGIRNQNEEETDCGGVCQVCQRIEAADLITQGAEYIDSGIQGEIDLLGKVENPNNNFGSSIFEYQFNFKDESGNIFYSKKGSSFILPGEKKYIVENNVPISKKPATLDFEILSTEWKEFNSFYEKPAMKIINKRYDESANGPIFGEAVGILKNESPFDFNVIKIKVILRNSEDKILALNSTEMRTVKSGEEREFKAIWSSRFPGVVAKMEIQNEINIFDSQSFLERFYKPKKFQDSF